MNKFKTARRQTVFYLEEMDKAGRLGLRFGQTIIPEGFTPQQIEDPQSRKQLY